MRYGATPEEWKHFSRTLGLREDLLPVVSNPNAKISSKSKMKSVGKTPSRYYSGRMAGGIKDWTQHRTPREEIAAWADEPDYGICIQTRHVRAIDVDITDENLARRIRSTINNYFSPDDLPPVRSRADAVKFLAAFYIEAGTDYTKRILKTAHGAIEFLATGQQFVAIGTHPSGARYEWEGGLPERIPEIAADDLERLWSELEAAYATERSVEQRKSIKAEKIAQAASRDPVAQHLLENGWVRSTERDGRLHITCPWDELHTNESADSSTTYFPAHTGGYENGHFLCMHAHCSDRNDDDFLTAIGLGDFDNLDAEPPEDGVGAHNSTSRFAVMGIDEFANRPPPRWIVKTILPEAGLAVVFGPPGSGKSFWVLDITLAIARGEDWREHRVQQGSVVYIIAEGQHGFRNRLVAYQEHHGISLSSVPFGVIADAPNFLEADQMRAVLKQIRAFDEHPKVIVVDTLAQVLSGGNENDAKDMGKLLAHCRTLHKHTGSLVVLIHHTGKDDSRGARGHSSLRGAADAMFKVTDFHGNRNAFVDKLKDAEDQFDLDFVLETVKIGEDDDGDDITSCVVTQTESRQTTATPGRPKGGLYHQVIDNVLREELVLSDDIEASVLIDLAVNQLVYDPQEGQRDRRRNNIMRALDTMIASGWLAKDGSRISKG
jgi:AAA domain/Bifunctional DNA primase/polymerase, N-terminal